MLKKLTVLLTLILAAWSVGGTTAQAEVSQRDQQAAAQRAYEASRQDYNDAARGFQRFQDAAEAIRDAAREILRNSR